MQEFSRQIHNSGGDYITWLIWHYQVKEFWTLDDGSVAAGLGLLP